MSADDNMCWNSWRMATQIAAAQLSKKMYATQLAASWSWLSCLTARYTACIAPQPTTAAMEMSRPTAR